MNEKMNGEMLYVHYGCKAHEFHLEKCGKVQNHPVCNKATGGLWASPAGYLGSAHQQKKKIFGWEEFCRREEYQPRGGLVSKFYFYVDTDANVVRIDKEEDCKWLPKRKIFGAAEQQMWEYIDFEECVRQGIEAVEYCYSAAHASREQGEKMDRLMFGWDCDSILIMNPKIIRCLKTDTVGKDAAGLRCL